MTLRRLFFWTHLVAGVIAGVVILVMAVTGVALTYERQLIKWSDRVYWPPLVDGSERKALDHVIEGFEQATSLTPSGVTVAADPAAPVVMQVERRTFFVSPYSGRVLGEATSGMRTALADIRAWHRWLAAEGDARTTARAVTGWANVLFLFMVLSGIYLWFPRRWTRQSLRAVAVPRWSAAGRARDFNWHNALGIWAAVPLAIVVASAVPISFPWGNALVYRVVGEEPPAQGRGREPVRPAESRGERTAREARASGLTQAETALAAPRPTVQSLLDVAQAQEPDWRSITLRLQADGTPLAFAIDRGDGGQPHMRSTLTLARDGSVQSYETFADQSTGRRLRSILRFAHTGEVLGLPGQTVAGLATGASIVLVWTGLALAVRRAAAWARRRSAVAGSATEHQAA